MSTRMVQNGSITTGTNSSSTYAEGENKNTIIVYKYIYNLIGANNYYGSNTKTANILLSVILALFVILIVWIVYKSMSGNPSTNNIKFGVSMKGGSRGYYNMGNTPQIVNDIFN